MDFAVAMVLVISFSIAFWMCYFWGALSDIFDGVFARKINQRAKL